MRIRYTRPALADLDDILAYLGPRSATGARRVREALRTAQGIISDHPEADRMTTLPWLRRLRTPGYPYLVFYEVEAGSIVIHAVRHESRDPASMPGE